MVADLKLSTTSSDDAITVLSPSGGTTITPAGAGQVIGSASEVGREAANLVGATSRAATTMGR